MIKRFSKFINESENRNYEDFGLDGRFEWVKDIMSEVENLLNEAEDIKKRYNYNYHRNSDSFEFNIKAQSFPEFEKISGDFNLDIDYVYEIWNNFLNENLQMYSDDVVENSKFLEAWTTTGRSGGWLCFKYRNYLFDEPDDYIQEIVDVLNDYTSEISEEDFNFYQDLKQASNPAYKFLRRIEVQPVSDDIIQAEKETKNVIEKLIGEFKELKSLKKELASIQKDINNFWKNAEANFEGFLKSEIE
jgi:hypothetical protein